MVLTIDSLCDKLSYRVIEKLRDRKQTAKMMIVKRRRTVQK